MTTEDGLPTAVCTDIARKVFHINVDGQQIRDSNLNIFYNKIEKRIIEEVCRVHDESVYAEEYPYSQLLNEKIRENKKQAMDKNKIIKTLAELSYLPSKNLLCGTIDPPTDG